MPIEFEGELSFSVDGPGGSSAGTMHGAGRTLRVHADNPVAAWDAALGSVGTGPAVLDRAAGFLADEDAVVEVSGPDGLVATIGAGVDSRVGRLLAGSRHVRLGRPAAIRPLAVAQVRRSAGRTVQVALVTAGLAVAAAVAARRARR